MTVNLTELGAPDPGHADPAFQPSDALPDDTALQADVASIISEAQQEKSAMTRGIKDALRARVYAQEQALRTEAAEQALTEAEEHAAGLAIRLDPGERRTLSFGLGATLTASLVILDIFPLNWAAQAFGLGSAGTWLVTLILLVASLGAMLGLEITRGLPRRRAALAAVIGAGFLALLGLRTEFLITVAGDSFPAAMFQSALLTAISAGLVLCGSAILARTRSLAHSRARSAAHRAAQAAADARAAQAHATENLNRHIATLHQQLLPWALRSAPAGVDHARWAAALERAIRALFPLT